MTQEGAPLGNINALKHGAFRRDLQLEDGMHTRAEVVQALRRRALKADRVCDLVINYVAGKVNAGHDLDSIPAAGKIPAFQNSAARLLQALYIVLPDDANVIDAELSRIDEVLSGNSREIAE